MTVPHRAVYFLMLAALCATLDIAGVATNLMVAKLPPLDAHIEYSLWRVCVSAADDGSDKTSDNCVNYEDNDAKKNFFWSDCGMQTIRTLRAFAILSIVFAFIVCIGLGIVDLMKRLPARHGTVLLIVSALLLCIFQMVYWIVWAAYFDHGCDNDIPSSKLHDSHWGPSPCLFIASSAVALAMVAVPFVVRGPRGGGDEVIAILG